MAQGDSKQDLAEDRTDLAEDRTVQATERTFAGWMRTSFAAIGVGVAFHALFPQLEPQWVGKLIATLFVVLGAVIALTAERRACATFNRLKAHEVATFGIPSIRWISWSIVAGALTLVAALWLFVDGS
jgi:putative membrane protein